MNPQEGLVLVVDDVTSTRNLIQRRLTSKKYRVGTVPSSQIRDAKSLLNYCREQPTALVIDLFLEGGFEKSLRIINELRTNTDTKDIRIVAISLLFYLVQHKELSDDRIRDKGYRFTYEALQKISQEVEGMPGIITIAKDFSGAEPPDFYDRVAQALSA